MNVVNVNDVVIKNRKRNLDNKKVDELVESIEFQGLIHPILITKGNELIAGHHRLAAFKKLEKTEIPCIVTDESDPLKIELNEIDENLIRNELHYWDRGQHIKRREEILQEMGLRAKRGDNRYSRPATVAGHKTTEDIGKELGVSERTIQEEKQIANKVLPEAEETIKQNDVGKRDALKLSRMGKDEQKQVIDQINEGRDFKSAVHHVKKEQYKKQRESNVNDVKVHNLIHGDCIDELKKLDDGVIDCVITDPPYGIGYKSNHRGYENDVTVEVEGDDQVDHALFLWDQTCRVLFEKMKEDSTMYMFTSWKVYGEFKKITEKYFHVKNALIWVKNNWSMGDLEGNFAEQYEMVLFATKGKPKLFGKREPNVLNYDRVSNHQLKHSCEKPIPLIEYLIDKSTIEKEFIVDPFCGSGATVEACINKNRNWLAIEKNEQHYQTSLERTRGVLL